MLSLVILIIALVAGLMGALLGLGGGFIIVPSLTLLLGVPIHQAIGASFVGVLINSSSSSPFYIKQGLANLRLGTLLELGTLGGAVAGASVALSLEREVLSIIFGVALLYAAFVMLRGRDVPRSEETVERNGEGSGFELKSSYLDASTNSLISYRVKNIRLGMLLSLLGGCFSGLLGLGGGAVLVPIQNRIMGIPVKVAVATSTLIIGVTAAAGATIFISQGALDPGLALPIALGVFVGAQVGSRIANVAEGNLIRRVFVVSLAYIAIQMTASGLGLRLFP